MEDDIRTLVMKTRTPRPFGAPVKLKGMKLLRQDGAGTGACG